MLYHQRNLIHSKSYQITEFDLNKTHLMILITNDGSLEGFKFLLVILTCTVL